MKDETLTIWNQRYAHLRPLRVFTPTSVEGVKKALQYATQNNLKVSVICGGHNYEGFCIKDGGVVINVENFKELTVTGNTGTFGAGWLQNKLYEALKPDWVMSGGICEDVSATGAILGGGTGIYHRAYGLACDNALSFRVITPDRGDLVCDAHRHKELFWACRGAGNGNFGVVLSTKVRLYPLKEVTNFRIEWAWDTKVPVNWQKWLAKADTRIGSVTLDLGDYERIGRPEKIVCLGLMLGSERETKIALAELLNASPKPASVEYRPESKMDAGLHACGLSELDPNHDWDQERAFFLSAADKEAGRRWKSTGLVSHRVIPEAEISKLGLLMDTTPNSFEGFSVAFVGLGGVIDRVSPQSTAYPHRGARSMLRIVGRWKEAGDDEANLKFHLDVKSFLSNATQSKSYYFNYCDLEIDNFLHAYFAGGVNTLVGVKRTYDAGDLFAYKQGLPVRRAGKSG